MFIVLVLVVIQNLGIWKHAVYCWSTIWKQCVWPRGLVNGNILLSLISVALKKKKNSRPSQLSQIWQSSPHWDIDILLLEQPTQRQPLLVQYKQQANPLLSMNNHTPLLISGKDTNKQQTLLSQCKLALTATKYFLHYTIIGTPRNSKNSPVLYLGLNLTIHYNSSWDLA